MPDGGSGGGNGSAFGVVVIGRNEGGRLARCLQSMRGMTGTVVYVDSGSSDSSPALARRLGASVVALDLSIPFTAARARNEGFRRLRRMAPEARYVQFVDGDCEVAQGWLGTAVRFLEEHPRVSVVCGRRREKYPERSVYNALCDIEWDTPVGKARACGGDAMMRVDAFEAARGFRPDLISGEEPELCLRLRAAGWLVWRVPAEMTRHDAAMYRFGQWWQRNLRGGYAFAQGASIHGDAPERHWVRESRSAWLWGLGIPLAAIALATGWSAWGWALLAVYPLQIARIALRERHCIQSNWRHAGFLVLGKFPEMLGQLRFAAHRAAGRQARLIEYK